MSHAAPAAGESDPPEPVAAHALERTPEPVELAPARELVDLGRHAEAESLAGKVLVEFESRYGADSLEVAKALDLLVEAAAQGGKWRDPELRALAQRAVRIKVTIFGEDHPETAWSRLSVGALLYVDGDLKGAGAIFDRCLEVQERTLGRDHPDVAHTLLWLSMMRHAADDHVAALAFARRALSIREQALGWNDQWTLSALQSVVVQLSYTGDYEGTLESSRRLSESLRATLGSSHPQYAWSLKGLADTLVGVGDYAEAESLSAQALQILETAPGSDPIYLAGTLGTRGVVLGRLGDYGGSLEVFQRGLPIVEKVTGADSGQFSTYLSALAQALARVGRRDEAGPMFERALAIAREAAAQRSTRETSVLRWYGQFLLDGGQNSKAEGAFERAVMLTEEVARTETPAETDLLDSLAEAHLREGDVSGARPVVEKSLRLKGEHLGLDVSLGQLARIRRATGEKSEALDAALRSEEMGREQLRLSSRSMPESQALVYAASRPRGLDMALSIGADGVEPDSAVRIWDAVIRSRALVLDQIGARHRAAADAGNADVAILREKLASARQRLANIRVAGPGPMPAENYFHLLDRMTHQKEELERALAEKSASFRDEQLREHLGFEDVQTALPVDSALVAYVRYDHFRAGMPDKEHAPAFYEGEPRYLAFVVGPGQGGPEIVRLGGAEEIENSIERWRREAGSEPSPLAAAAAEERVCRQAGLRLRQAIWDPVMKEFAGVRQVFVVADGAIDLVNLAALPGEDGHYLVESSPLIQYLSAERDLVRPGREARRGKGLLVFGAPDFDAGPMRVARNGDTHPRDRATASDSSEEALRPLYRGPTSKCEGFRSLNFESLPGARAEAGEIASIWRHSRQDFGLGGDVVEFTGGKAGEEVFKRLSGEFRVVHVATHGFFIDDRCASSQKSARQSSSLQNPLLLSGMALAGANRRGEVGPDMDVDDGILTAEEIASLDLRGVEWVVLSACETGMGRVQAGEGVLGLRRAFEEAGAGTLIMSLWKVNDESSREWMQHLYRARLSGLSTVESVSKASVRMIEAARREGRTTHPFFWGAFVAAGEWR